MFIKVISLKYEKIYFGDRVPLSQTGNIFATKGLYFNHEIEEKICTSYAPYLNKMGVDCSPCTRAKITNR